MIPAVWKSQSIQRSLALALAFCALTCRACAASSVDFELPNGLRVLVRERHQARLVAIELWVRAGAREERPGEAGAAHFLEHTLFKGTKTRRAGEADRAIENLGATLSAATGPDYARFYTSVGSEHADEALAILADVIRNAELPAEEIERERPVILTELAQRDADPAAQLIDRLYGIVYRGLPYGTPPGGTAASIQARTRDQLAAFYRRVYVPSRCTLVLVGELTGERAREIAEHAFGDWSGPHAEPQSVTAAQKDGQKPRTQGSGANTDGNGNAALPMPPAQFAATAEVAYPMLGVAFRAPAASEGTACCAAQVVAALLGQSDIGGRLAAARLSGCEARVSFAPRHDASLFLVSAAGRPASGSRNRTDETALIAARQAALDVLDSLQSAPPTAGEVAAAKSALLGRAIFESETNTGLASAVGIVAITGGQTPEAWRSAIDKITVQEVRRFIEQWLGPSRRMTLLLLPGHAAAAPEARP